MPQPQTPVGGISVPYEGYDPDLDRLDGHPDSVLNYYFQYVIFGLKWFKSTWIGGHVVNYIGKVSRGDLDSDQVLLLVIFAIALKTYLYFYFTQTDATTRKQIIQAQERRKAKALKKEKQDGNSNAKGKNSRANSKNSNKNAMPPVGSRRDNSPLKINGRIAEIENKYDRLKNVNAMTRIKQFAAAEQALERENDLEVFNANVAQRFSQNLNPVAINLRDLADSYLPVENARMAMMALAEGKEGSKEGSPKLSEEDRLKLAEKLLLPHQIYTKDGKRLKRGVIFRASNPFRNPEVYELKLMEKQKEKIEKSEGEGENPKEPNLKEINSKEGVPLSPRLPLNISTLIDLRHGLEKKTDILTGRGELVERFPDLFSLAPKSEIAKHEAQSRMPSNTGDVLRQQRVQQLRRRIKENVREMEAKLGEDPRDADEQGSGESGEGNSDNVKSSEEGEGVSRSDPPAVLKGGNTDGNQKESPNGAKPQSRKGEKYKTPPSAFSLKTGLRQFKFEMWISPFDTFSLNEKILAFVFLVTCLFLYPPTRFIAFFFPRGIPVFGLLGKEPEDGGEGNMFFPNKAAELKRQEAKEKRQAALNRAQHAVKQADLARKAAEMGHIECTPCAEADDADNESNSPPKWKDKRIYPMRPVQLLKTALMNMGKNANFRFLNEFGLRGFYLYLVERCQGLIMDTLVEATRSEGPVVLHCSMGKDRTGVTCALLLAAVGVERSVILDQYEATPSFAHANMQKVYKKKYGDMIKDSLIPNAASRTMLETCLAYLEHDYGSLIGFLDFIGFDESWRAMLREKLVERE